MRKVFPSGLLTGLFFVCFFFLFSKNVLAATTYYISPSGSDSNTGTQSSPFSTFDYAISQLSAGDTLIALDGTYNQRIVVSSSINGTSTNPITIRSANPKGAVISYTSGYEDSNVDIDGDYIVVDGFEVKGADGYCVDLRGDYDTAQFLKVHDCQAHGIYTDSSHTIIKNNEVYLATLVNENRDMPHSWGSGIKVRVGGDNVLIENNTVYHNYGEGIAVTRGTNSIVRGNTTYDNYSVNIYIDNSYNVLVENNFSYCTANSGFERLENGSWRRPEAFGMEEEYYSGWGAQLHDVTFQNNIGFECNRGLYYWNSGISGSGMKNISFIHNTFVNMTRYSMAIEVTGTDYNNVIANNVFYQSNDNFGYVDGNGEISFHHNLFSKTPDSSLKGAGDVYQNPQFTSTPNISDLASFQLGNTSPAINAGDTLGVSFDFFGNNRDSQPDMGAYEYGSGVQPSPSPTPSPSPSPSPDAQCQTTADCPTNYQCYQPLDIAKVCRLYGDANLDGKVNIVDYSIMSNEFFKTLDHYQSDFTEDNKVDIADFSLLNANFSLL